MTTRSKPARVCLAVLAPLLAVHAAVDHDAIFEEAVRAIDDEYMQSWSYTETSQVSEATLVGRYDPRGAIGDRWTLLSVDGRAPTDEEIADYEDDKEEDTESDSDDDDNEVAAMVEPGSLSLIEETENYYLFTFTPTDDEDDFLEHVDATVKIIKAGPYIEYVDLRSAKPFRPQFGVKIKEFVTRLSFAPAAINGPIVPMSIDVRIKARAFLFVGIDETVSISYSDYQYAGNPSEKVPE